MPEPETSSADLDPRRRRALFRARHRGLREMDVLLGSFANAHIASLDDGEMDALESLLDLPDRDVLSWLTGQLVLPQEFDTPLMQKLIAFHSHSGPIHK